MKTIPLMVKQLISFILDFSYRLFGFKKNHLKLELESINNLFAPVGHIVLQWSYVDLNLELCLNIISEDYDTINLIPTKSKYILTKRKIELFSQCLEQLPSLSSFRDEGLLIVKTAIQFNKVRNIIIHGTYAGVNNDRSYNFHRLVFNKQRGYIIEEYPYTLAGLIHLGKMIRGLATDIGQFGLHLRPSKGAP